MKNSVAKNIQGRIAQPLNLLGRSFDSTLLQVDTCKRTEK